MLAFGFKFSDLNNLSGLKKLDKFFMRRLKTQDIDAYYHLKTLRKNNSEVQTSKENSNFLLKISPYLDDFLAELFNIEKDVTQHREQIKDFDIIYECRRKFIQRKLDFTYHVSDEGFQKSCANLSMYIDEKITELTLAKNILFWAHDQDKYNRQLHAAMKFCTYMVQNHSNLALFDVPQKIDEENHIRQHKIKQIQKTPYVGFGHRDPEIALSKNFDAKSHSHSKYCIYCHNQSKDSCSNGLIDKQTNDIIKDKKGCPINMKISEMTKLKSSGFSLSALAMAIVDNPLLAATGHRICNDCMKSCIFQKQDPVNIPMVETSILENVLNLPWGVEIYILLTKWNPLNIASPLPKANNNSKILVTGLGPAGFALSYYLLREGHNVIAIDGQKISPLEFDYNKPIQFWNNIKQGLTSKQPLGFGGVAEYGITARWDKNYLTLIRLLLERNSNFTIRGSTRLGSNISLNQAMEQGLDHISLCIGAGKPKYDTLPGYFAKNVMSAASFLMELHQGDEYIQNTKKRKFIRMPCAVIGAGLTAIDSAVELMHYYPLQVESFYTEWGDKLEEAYKKFSKDLVNEFAEHAKLFMNAKNDSEKIKIMHDLGGVSIYYRKNIKDSPAYKLNHEEIEHAKALGVNFFENYEPKEIKTDDENYAQYIEFSNQITKPAKAILIAIGTEQNEFLDIFDFKKNDSDDSVFVNDSNKISYLGDCNPKYTGSVVKAIASAKDNYQEISSSALSAKSTQVLSGRQDLSDAKIISNKSLASNITELIIHSSAAKNTQAGQFFKLQNFGDVADSQMQPLALTASEIDIEKQNITFIINNKNLSTNIASNLKIGKKISLMGPVGSGYSIQEKNQLVIITKDLSNLLMLEISKKAKKLGCEVIHIAHYSKKSELIQQTKIENASNKIIWVCEDATIEASRKNDHSIKGSIIEAINYIKNNNILQKNCNIICNIPKEFIPIIKDSGLVSKSTKIYINSQMHCMMKGICGKCIIPAKNKRGYVFSCSSQMIDIDLV